MCVSMFICVLCVSVCENVQVCVVSESVFGSECEWVFGAGV
jgi:hypothetical protein